MLYAQFYQQHAGKVTEACGDRSVIILDARTPCGRYRDLVKAVARERGYVGFSLHRGESFTRSTCVLSYTPVGQP